MEPREARAVSVVQAEEPAVALVATAVPKASAALGVGSARSAHATARQERRHLVAAGSAEPRADSAAQQAE